MSGGRLGSAYFHETGAKCYRPEMIHLRAQLNRTKQTDRRAVLEGVALCGYAERWTGLVARRPYWKQ
jgi:hypothetical protein